MDRQEETRISRLIRKILRRDTDPQDPYSKVRVPVKKGPGGLKASVALEEPRRRNSEQAE